MHLKKILSITCLYVLPIHIEACTLTFWNTNAISPMVGRTMDLYQEDNPSLVVYPRGIKREGSDDNPLAWRSKYGSVVITAFDSSNISEGINEVGLSASLLYLEETKYEARDFSKPSISIGLWAQYLLDNYKTVSEALNSLSTFQVVSVPIAGRHWPTHLTIQDKSGDMAIIEYVQGQMKIHHGPQYHVVANEPIYEQQLSNLKRYQLFGGTLPIPGTFDSMSRFVRASSYLKTLPQPKDETEAAILLMGVMRTVMVPEGARDSSAPQSTTAWPTRWVSIKDLKHQVLYIQLTSSLNLLWVDLHTLEFQKGRPTLQIKLNDPSSLGGDITNQLQPVK